MKTLSKLLIVPTIALGLILSGVSIDAMAATTCKNGMCKMKVTHHRTHHRTLSHHRYYRGSGYSCGCRSCCGL